MSDFWRWLRCRFGSCPGYVVSGVHGDWIWIGFRCAECGKVSGYQPTRFIRHER